MRKRYGLAILGLSILALVGNARAATTRDDFLLRNTGDLVALCSAPTTDPLYTAATNFCHGFAVGVYRVLHEQGMAQPSARLFCLPNPPPTRTEAITAMLAWFKANQGYMTQPAADGVAAFLVHEYPCSRRR